MKDHNKRNTLTFKLLLFNPWSLNNKIYDFMHTVLDNSVDIAAVCETWFSESSNPTTAIIKSFGFSIIHNFRKDRKGGGTALIYKSCYNLSPITFPHTYKTFEITAAVAKSDTSKVIFVVLYRTGPLSTLFIQELDLLLADLSGRTDSFVLSGDFNIHFELCSSNKLINQSLQLIQSYGLRKLVDSPTHISGGSLDQIFVYSLKNQLNCSTLVEPDNSLSSDHFPVYCNIELILTTKYYKKIQYRNIKDLCMFEFQSQLHDIVNKSIDSHDTFEETLSTLSSDTATLLDDLAPLREKTVSVVETAPWFDSEYRDKRKERRRAEKKWKNEKDECKKQHLKLILREECIATTKLANENKKLFMSRMIENANGNPRTLYEHVNRALDRKQGKLLPDTSDNIEELAKSFNEFFVDKISKIRENMPMCSLPIMQENPEGERFTEFEPATLEEIKGIIKDAGIKTSPNDLLPQQLYKENLDTLLPVILKLVNLSLSTGNVEGVKMADIVPLLKDDSLDPNVLKNYRPVSNLCFVGKIIERVVLTRLNDHLTKQGLHCPEQYAYKKNHSTETLLIKITNDLLIAADERSATVVMLLDLSAAFDTVDHNLLLSILEKEIGLGGTVLSWFKSFLTGRSQRIRLGKVTSEVIYIKFGVPQGSVLGPVLFNLYIRSIYSCVKRLGFNILGYADDHQILKSFKSKSQSEVLTVQLQYCFEVIKRWMNHFFLQLNDTKTQLIVFGPRNVLNELHINGVQLSSSTTIRFVSTVKNLGFHMDSCLTFDKQVAELKQKCYRTIRNIRKIKFLLNPAQVKVIVNSLVVSCLDYCNGLFYGASEKILRQLQLIQNSASKVITGKYKHDHLEDDLRQLHWLNIRKRIIFKIGLLAYKAINGIAPQYLQDMFQFSHHGHNLKLMVPATISKYGDKSFSVIGPKIFNNLPLHVTTSISLDSFKCSLKTYLFSLSDYELRNLFS